MSLEKRFDPHPFMWRKVYFRSMDLGISKSDVGCQREFKMLPGPGRPKHFSQRLIPKLRRFEQSLTHRSCTDRVQYASRARSSEAILFCQSQHLIPHETESFQVQVGNFKLAAFP